MRGKIRRTLVAVLLGGVATLIGFMTRPPIQAYAPGYLAGSWTARIVEDRAPMGSMPVDSSRLSGTFRLAPPPDLPSRTLPPFPGSHTALDFAPLGFTSSGGPGSSIVVRELGGGEVEMTLPSYQVVLRGWLSGDRIAGRWWHAREVGGGSGSFVLRRMGG